MAKQYYTVKETADYLGLKPKTIYNWLSENICPIAYTPLNGKKLFSISDIEAYMKRNRVAPAAEVKANIAA